MRRTGSAGENAAGGDASSGGDAEAEAGNVVDRVSRVGTGRGAGTEETGMGPEGTNTGDKGVAEVVGVTWMESALALRCIALGIGGGRATPLA